MLSSLARRNLVRVAAALGALLLVVFSASAARVTIPGLREATRGTVVTSRMPHRWRGRHRANVAHIAGGTRAVRRALRTIVRWVYPFQHLTELPALAGRAPGAYAHSGIERRHRWATLGGHGRHGAG